MFNCIPVAQGKLSVFLQKMQQIRETPGNFYNIHRAQKTWTIIFSISINITSISIR